MDLSQFNQDLATLQEIAARLRKIGPKLFPQDRENIFDALAAIEDCLEPHADREAVLAESRRHKALLDAIFEADPGALAVVAGDDLRFVHVNATYRFLCPDPFEDPIGERYEAVWAAAGGEHYADQIWRALNTGQPFLKNGFELPLSIGITRTFTFQARRIDWVGEPAVLVILWDTTELEKSNQALLESQQRIASEQEWFRTTLASIGDAVITTDPQGDVTFLNPVAEQLTGWTRAEAAGLPMKQVIPIINEQTHKPAKNPVEKVLHEGLIVGLANHTALVARDGRQIPIEDSAAPIRDQAGKILGVVMVFHDVTEKRKSEAAVRESQTRFMAIFQHAPIGIALSNQASGAVLEVNDAFEKMFGYARTEIIGRTSAELGIAPDPQAREQLLRQIQEQGYAHHVKLAYRDRGGAQVALLGNIDLITIAKEKYILSTFENVTARERAEEEARRSQQKTREVLESIQDGFMELDRGWRFTFLNRRAAQNIGLQPEAVLGKNLWETFPAILGTPQERFYRQAMEQRQPAQLEVKGVLTQQWYDMHAYPSEEGITILWTDITARRQAEQAVQESQTQNAFLASVIELSSQAFGVGNRDGSLGLVNHAFEQLTGYSTDELHSMDWATTLTPPEWVEIEQQQLSRLQTSGVPVRYEKEYLRKDGTRVPIELLVHLGRDAEGNAQYYYSFINDISERKQAEKQLKQLNHLIELSYEPIFTWDLDGGILSWNQGCASLYGYSQEEAIGRVSHELLQTLHPLSPEGFKAELLQSGAWTGELVHRTKDGREVIIESRQQLVEMAERQLVLETNRDITERKRAEEAIRESEQRYRGLFETMQEALFAVEIIKDAEQTPVDWRYLDVNPQTERFMGLAYDQMVGHTYSEVVAHPDPAWIALLEKVARTGEPANQVLYSPARKRWLQVSANSLRPGQVVALFYDVTERINAENSLRESEARLVDALEGTHDCFYALDRDWRITYVNRRYAEIVGRQVADLTGKNFWEAFPNYQGTLVEQQFRRAMVERAPAHFQSGGHYSEKWFEISVYPTREGLSVFATDRTSEKRTELALQQALQQAEAGQQTLEAALNSMSDAVFISDAEGNFIHFNDAFASYHRFPNMEECARTFAENPDILDVFFPDGTLAPTEMWAVPRALRGETAANAEYGLRRKDTGERWVGSYNFAPIRDKDGAIVGSVTVGRDITESKQTEKTIHRKNELMHAINCILEESLSSESPKQLGRACLPIIETLTGSQFSFIGEPGPDGFWHDLAISEPGWAACTQPDQSGHRLPLGTFEVHGLYGRMLADGKSLIANDLASHPDNINLPEGHPRLKAFLGVPLIVEGKSTGVIAVANRENGYSQAEQEDLEALAPVIVEALMRARAEQALRESEARYRAIGESIDYGVWVCAPDGRNTYASDSFLKLVGLTQEQCSSFGWGDVLHPDDAERTLAAWQECVRSGGTWDIEHRFRGTDGEWHPILARGVPVRNAAGQVTAWVGINLDISRMKKAEEGLKAALEQVAWLARFPEENPNPVARVTSTGRVLYRNRPAAETPGWQLVVEQPLPAPLFQLVEQGLSSDGELQEDIEMGGRYFSVSLVPCLDEGYINMYGRDVTTRKAVEKALAESEEKYRTTLASIGDAVITTDAQGSVTYLNPMAERLTGWTGAEALGQPLELIFPMINEQTEQPTQNPVGKVLSQGGIVGLANHTVLVARDGHLVPIEDSAAPICDQVGNITGVVMVFHDVSEKRKAEQALRESQALLQAVLEGTPDPVFLKDRHSRILLANPATLKVIGKPAEQVLGRSDAEVYDDPTVGRTIMENDRRVMEAGRTDVIEECVQTPEGKRTFLSTKTPYRDAAGNVVGVIGLAHDISERKVREKELERLNRTLRALSNSSQAMLRAEDETSYMAEVCRIVTEDCGHAMVWIGMAEKDRRKSVRPVAYAGFEAGYLETLGITWANNQRGRGPTGTAIRTGRPSMCRNMHTDPAFAHWREQALKRGYASSLVLPLLAQGKAFGVISVYSREPDPFREDEVRLLSELANDLAYGITSIRLREARNKAETALREREARYRSLFQDMTEGFALHEIICDAAGKPVDYRFLEINPAFEQMTGLSRDMTEGHTVLEVMPGVEAFWIETYGRVALTGEPAHFQNYTAPLKKYFEVVAFSPQRGQFAVLFIDITERVRWEAENRKMASDLEIKHRLIEQREQERIQIARDLHDGPVQELIAVTYILHGLMMDPLDPAILKELAEVKTSIHNQVTELRNYAMELRPPVLSRMGLDSTIRVHLENFRAKHANLEIKFKADPEAINLPEETRVALFRIYQEGLNNIAKHAQASHVSIRFGRDDAGRVVLELSDDGVGFEVPSDWLSLARKGHLGLVGMRERVEAIGGKLECESTPGAGATIRVVIRQP